MENFDLSLRYKKAIELAKEAGELAKEGFFSTDSGVEIKCGRELVTKYDKLIEKFLKEKIAEFFPQDSFMGEEFDNNFDSLQNDGCLWIIDPIDGTNNFAHKIPIFGISIGMYFNGEPTIGVVYNPITNELFRAKKGEKAFCNDKEIFTSNNADMKNSIMATGFPYNRTCMEDSNIFEISKVILKASGLRRMGAASIDICYVASGKMDGYWETGLKPWDVAGGIVIANECGCKISNFDGEEYKIGTNKFVVTNTKIHQQLLDCLK